MLLHPLLQSFVAVLGVTTFLVVLLVVVYTVLLPQMLPLHESQGNKTYRFKSLLQYYMILFLVDHITYILFTFSTNKACKKFFIYTHLQWSLFKSLHYWFFIQFLTFNDYKNCWWMLENKVKTKQKIFLKGVTYARVFACAQSRLTSLMGMMCFDRYSQKSLTSFFIIKCLR